MAIKNSVLFSLTVLDMHPHFVNVYLFSQVDGETFWPMKALVS